MQRRDGFTKVELAIVIVILLILAAILIPAFRTFRKTGYPNNRSTCSSHLKQMGIAWMQYAQEYDERTPPVKFNNVAQSLPPYAKPFGWADALQPYLRSTELLQCPSVENVERPLNATKQNFTDYWMNTNLSNLKLEKLNAPSQTILAGDGNDGTDATNARYNLNALPQSWRDTEKSPARRHLDTANYLYADGHVKSLRPQNVKNVPIGQLNASEEHQATFAIR